MKRTNYRLVLLLAWMLAGIMNGIGAQTNRGEKLIDRSILLNKQGRYPDAVAYAERAEKYTRIHEGDSSEAHFIAMNNLGWVYENNGQYDRALELYQRELPMITARVGMCSGLVRSQFLSHFASCYRAVKDYGMSETYYLLTLRSDTIAAEQDSVSHATHLSNFAQLYLEQGRNQEAEPLFRKAFNLYTARQIERTDSMDLAILTGNLGCLYVLLGRYEEGITMHMRVNSMFQKLIGKRHIHYAGNLNNLGEAYRDAGDYQQADSFFAESLHLVDSLLGKSHPNYGIVLMNRAMNIALMGDCQAEIAVCKEALAFLQEEDQHMYHLLSEPERSEYWRVRHLLYSLFYAYSALPSPSQDCLGEVAFNAALFQKQFALRSDKQFHAAFRATKSKSLRRKYADWDALNHHITALRMNADEASKALLSQLDQQWLQLRADLAAQSAAFRELEASFETDLNAIRRRLPERSVLLEFVHFPKMLGTDFSDTTIYGVYIVRPSDALPRFIPLFPSTIFQVEASTLPFQIAKISQRMDLMRGPDGIAPSRMDPSDTVAQRLWDSIEPFLEDVEEVYYAPVGLIHNLALPALPIGKGRYLSDKYRLHVLGASAGLVHAKPLFAKECASISLYGDIEYNSSGKPTSNSEVNPWMPLAGTEKEVLAITRLASAQKFNSTALTGKEASETSFKQLASDPPAASPSLIHLATHGFSYTQSASARQADAIDSPSAFLHSEDPMLRSGLIFSGANHVWLGSEPIPGVDDGILTAAEIANMNLSDTKLVVLSACQSGLGEIQGTEGIFGLQRAFKLAGVELILATLWQVPDAETAEFMELFYTAFLKEGLEVRDAFFKAQAEMRERYRDEPYLWGAFVLLE